MECLTKTKISTKELSKIITSISTSTLQIYLSNYKFNKYRKTNSLGINAEYEISVNFLNLLYTLFWHRNRVKEAEKLKKYFKDFELKALSLEEFVK